MWRGLAGLLDAQSRGLTADPHRSTAEAGKSMSPEVSQILDPILSLRVGNVTPTAHPDIIRL